MRRFVGLLAASVAFGGALALRLSRVDDYGAARATYSLRKEALLSPGPRLLHLLAFEHHNAVADLAWLQIVQIIGAETATQEGVADRMERWADLTTDLDPLYYVVYYGSAVNLVAYAKRVDAADRILLKGTRNLPARWELFLVLGYNAYFVRGEPAQAAEYWLAASRLEGAPFWVLSLAARSKYHSGARSDAKELLRSLIPQLEPGPQRDEAESRLKLLESEELLQRYDAACLAFRDEAGRAPKPEELFMTQRVDAPPRDLFGNDIYFDEECRARTSLMQVREDEASKRIGSHK